MVKQLASIPEAAASFTVIQRYNPTLGMQPLHLAVQNRDYLSLRIFALHFQTNCCDYLSALRQLSYSGYAPIHTAAFYGDLQLLVFLLTHMGADKLVKEKFYGQNILHIATSRGQTDVVKFLVSSIFKDHLDDQDKDGFTALRVAVFKGLSQMCTLLLDNGASKLI